MEHEKTIMPRSVKSVTEARELLEAEGILNRPLLNKKFGIVATVSGNTADKMADTKATSKSISPALHAKAMANVDILFENAEIDVVHPDYRNNKNVKQVHRIGSIMYDDASGEYIPIMITLMEVLDSSGNRIYTVEALDIKKAWGEPQAKERNSAGQLVDLNRNNSGKDLTPIAEFNYKIHYLLEKVNSKRKKNKNSRTPLGV